MFSGSGQWRMRKEPMSASPLLTATFVSLSENGKLRTIFRSSARDGSAVKTSAATAAAMTKRTGLMQSSLEIEAILTRVRQLLIDRAGRLCAPDTSLLPDLEADLDRFGDLVVVGVHLHEEGVRVVDLALVERGRPVVFAEWLAVFAAGNGDDVFALVVLVAFPVRVVKLQHHRVRVFQVLLGLGEVVGVGPMADAEGVDRDVSDLDPDLDVLVASEGIAAVEFFRLGETRRGREERCGKSADRFAESGPYAELLDKYGMSVDAIVESARRAIKRKAGAGDKVVLETV